jgi:hypothetical protein
LADTVTSQLIENGNNVWVYQFTNLSDGTGESGVTKVDGSAAGPLGVVIQGNTFYPLSHIKVLEIEYDVKGMALEILWDATSPQAFAVLGGFGKQKYRQFGGISPYSAGTIIAGATGKILFTTKGAMANSAYTVTMIGRKGIHQ